MAENAIVLEHVSKKFKKYAVRKDARTFKSELIRVLLRRKRPVTPATHVTALEDIHLNIPRGKTLGLVGRNGSGKSTLLKLITGIYKPTGGKITVDGRISALLELGAGFHPDFTGRENILINGIILGMTRAEVRERIDEIITFSELGEYIDAPVRTYSSGMYMRLAFSVATHVNPDILIVDEILAVGDEHFSRKSLAKMTEFKRSGKTIVLVTHDLGTLQNWCDHAAWIDGGKIRMYGDPHDVVAAYRSAVAEAEAHAPTPANPQGLATTADAARTKAVRVTRVEAVGGDESGVYSPESGLKLRLQFEAEPDVRDVIFSVDLRRSDGPLVYGFNSRDDGLVLPSPLPASGVLEIAFDKLRLLDGEYLVEVTAESSLGVPYDANRGTHLRVSARVAEKGIARLEHRWSLASS